jgi:L-aspartate oxidase
VVAHQAAEACGARIRQGGRAPRIPAWDARGMRKPREAVGRSHNWDAVRRLMWDYVGIVRNDERLAKAAKRLALIREEVEADYERYVLDADLVEVRNLAQVADLIVVCARKRLESRGLHYNLDHLRRLKSQRHDTVIRRPARAGGRKRPRVL